MCVVLSWWNLYWGKEVLEKVFSKGKTSTPRSTPRWRGQISCTAAGREQEPGETARYSLRFSVSLPKLRLYTCIYNYSKYPVFSLSTSTKRVPPKQIFGLYLDVLTSRITYNEKHNWGHRGKETMRKHNHNTHLFIYFECMQSVPSQTWTHKHTGSQLLSKGLISAIVLEHTSGVLPVFLGFVISPMCLFIEKKENRYTPKTWIYGFVVYMLSQIYSLTEGNE